MFVAEANFSARQGPMLEHEMSKKEKMQDLDLHMNMNGHGSIVWFFVLSF
jgi:hypothetical protein